MAAHARNDVSESGASRLTLLLLTSVLLATSVANAACRDIYSCAIDARWPIEQSLSARAAYVRVITIRIIPGQSVDPETYLVLRIRADGTVDGDFQTPDGESLFAQIRRRATDTSVATEIAKALAIKTVSVYQGA
jgi:hypothetical protein